MVGSVCGHWLVNGENVEATTSAQWEFSFFQLNGFLRPYSDRHFGPILHLIVGGNKRTMHELKSSRTLQAGRKTKDDFFCWALGPPFFFCSSFIFIAMATENKKALVYSILEFLQKSCTDGTISADDSEGIEVAIQCIGESFGVDVNDPAQQELYNTKPANLLSIFDVYLKTKNKTKAPAPATAASSAAAPAEGKSSFS
ncbi:hypothetical protein DM01DRAFT_1177964 [Hesseltinella vesiculosa]|uniref:SGTA homodimerisation domain-containing protein n=1 Tax=Hesseltinella vesiculosa TaxID=101127 RepID=A0A1X2G4R4_9FUNG|nr:hypothetical protein DM01DRAFT_1177964 [Hesseltinella vesiculosa]